MHHGGKTGGIDMVWRNYVTDTLCIAENKPTSDKKSYTIAQQLLRWVTVWPQ